MPGEVRFSDRSLKFDKTHFSLERVRYPQLVIMANYYEMFKHFVIYARSHFLRESLVKVISRIQVFLLNDLISYLTEVR